MKVIYKLRLKEYWSNCGLVVVMNTEKWIINRLPKLVLRITLIYSVASSPYFFTSIIFTSFFTIDHIKAPHFSSALDHGPMKMRHCLFTKTFLRQCVIGLECLKIMFRHSNSTHCK